MLSHGHKFNYQLDSVSNEADSVPSVLINTSSYVIEFFKKKFGILDLCPKWGIVL